MGSASGVPPSTGTVYNRSKSAYASRDVLNTIFFPSGVQPTTTSEPGCQVILLGVPPSAGITYTSAFPSYSPVKAIDFPSGENEGWLSCPPVVNCRASPPDRGTLQTYPPQTNATSVFEIVGCCNSKGVSATAATHATSNN